MLISRLLLKDRSWFLLLGLILVVLLTSAVRWMLDYPNPNNWDEAQYLNDVLEDQSTLRHSGWRGLHPVILYSDRERPPAYRVLAIPFYLLLGFSPVMLRLVSLGFHWLGLAVVYLTTRKVASPKCAVLSVLICCLSPDVIFSSVLFYTEFPLFLATTGAFYFLVSSLESKSAARLEVDWPRPIDRPWLIGEGYVLTRRSSRLGVRARRWPRSRPQRSATIICRKGGCTGIVDCGAVVEVEPWPCHEARAIRASRHFGFIGFTGRSFVWERGYPGSFLSRRACWDTASPS